MPTNIVGTPQNNGDALGLQIMQHGRHFEPRMQHDMRRPASRRYSMVHHQRIHVERRQHGQHDFSAWAHAPADPPSAVCQIWCVAAVRFACVRMAPFGKPVVPPVYCSTANCGFPDRPPGGAPAVSLGGQHIGEAQNVSAPYATSDQVAGPPAEPEVTSLRLGREIGHACQRSASSAPYGPAAAASAETARAHPA